MPLKTNRKVTVSLSAKQEGRYTAPAVGAGVNE